MPWAKVSSPENFILETDPETGTQNDSTSTAAWLGRPAALHDSDTGANIASYQYLGANTVITATYPQPQISLAYLQQLSPVSTYLYAGLDRHGRIIDHRWIKTDPDSNSAAPNNFRSISDLDRILYTYSPASQRLSRSLPLATAQKQPLDEQYTYDPLSQLLTRQQLQNGATTLAPADVPQTETLSYDSAGNWTTYTQSDADLAPISTTSSTTRTHNLANEITRINDSPGSLAYDAAGNMVVIPSDPSVTGFPYTARWDAWGRLTRLQGGPATPLDIRYNYDGLHRRIRQIVLSGNAPSLDFYYNSEWKIIEERLIPEASLSVENSTTNSVANSTPKSVSTTLYAQYLYGIRNRNDLILRDAYLADSTVQTQSSTPPRDVILTRHYVLSDAMFSTTAIADSTGTILRRYIYSAFGTPTALNPDFTPIPSDVEPTPDPLQWNSLFHGEYYDLDTSLSNYGYRYYSPPLGRWLSRDPIEEGNLYVAARNNLESFADYLGLIDIASEILRGGGYFDAPELKCDSITQTCGGIPLGQLSIKKVELSPNSFEENWDGKCSGLGVRWKFPENPLGRGNDSSHFPPPPKAWEIPPRHSPPVYVFPKPLPPLAPILFPQKEITKSEAGKILFRAAIKSPEGKMIIKKLKDQIPPCILRELEDLSPTTSWGATKLTGLTGLAYVGIAGTSTLINDSIKVSTGSWTLYSTRAFGGNLEIKGGGWLEFEGLRLVNWGVSASFSFRF